MIQYKYIHLDNGYKTLLNTSDDNTVFEVSNLIDELRRSIKSKDRQDVYCYIYNEDKSIYYKENNSIVAAFIDCEKELKNRYKDKYPSDLLFDNSLIKIDNSNAPFQEKNLQLIRRNNCLVVPQRLKSITKFVDTLLDPTKRIAVVGNDVNAIRDYIVFALYLFPTSFARKVGYIVNVDYIPFNLNDDIFASVRIFGLTDANKDFFDMDLVINLNEEFREEELSSLYAKILNYDKNNQMVLEARSRELKDVFDEEGNYNPKLGEKILKEKIFEKEPTKDNFNELLNMSSQSQEKVSLKRFRLLFDYMLRNNVYDESTIQKISTIIQKNPEFNPYTSRLKERKILNYFDRFNDLTDLQLDEIADYLSNDTVELTAELEDLLNSLKENPKVYKIIFKIGVSSSFYKRMFVTNYLDYSMTYNIDLNNLPFDEYIANKIFQYGDTEEFKKLSLLYLYSTVKSFLENKYQALERRSVFIQRLIRMQLSKVKKIELIFELYYQIDNLLKEDVPDEIINFFNFELFNREQLNEIIAVNRSNEETEYLNLIEFISTYRKRNYGFLFDLIIQLILQGKSRVESNKMLYEKYITVNNYRKFTKILEFVDEDVKKEYSSFIEELRTEGEISSTIQNYRLEYIYSRYITAQVISKQRIAEKLGYKHGKNVDAEIKKELYEGTADKQQKIIDAIVDYVDSNDSMDTAGKSNFLKKIFTSFVLGFFFSIISFCFFNLPVIVKSYLIDDSIKNLFFNYNNIITPIVMIYSFVIFLILYSANNKKIRDNIGQVVRKTIGNWFCLVMIPCMFYVLLYLVKYFVL